MRSPVTGVVTVDSPCHLLIPTTLHSLLLTFLPSFPRDRERVGTFSYPSTTILIGAPKMTMTRFRDRELPPLWCSLRPLYPPPFQDYISTRICAQNSRSFLSSLARHHPLGLPRPVPMRFGCTGLVEPPDQTYCRRRDRAPSAPTV